MRPPTAAELPAHAASRRPGRLVRDTKVFVPLRHGDGEDGLTELDPLRPVLGIVVGLLISAPIWALIYLAGHLVFAGLGR